MRSKIIILVAMMVLGTTPVFGADVLTGDKALACEALLCLSSPSPPSECARALKKYYSIHRSKSWKTRRDRLRFLNLCPKVDAPATIMSK